MIRTRWTAIGAAIAITLGGGGVGLANATASSGVRAVFVPIEPCRVMDTRAEFQVGPRSTPLGPGETYVVAGRGATGNCTIPAGATALSLNVTAVDATAPTFLTIWGDGSRPTASSLNPTPGQPPTPNAVTTDLRNSNGRFNVFNLQGSVHVLADAVGYYVDHDHDDRYYTQAEIDQRAPRVNTITVGSSAFGVVDSSLSYVIRSTPGSGAYVFDGPLGIDRLVAPLVLPDGVTVTEIVVHHFDKDITAIDEDMTFRLQCERLDIPGVISERGSATSVDTEDWGTVSLSGLPEVIDTDTCAYFLEAAGRWELLTEPNDFSVAAFEITYETAG